MSLHIQAMAQNTANFLTSEEMTAYVTQRVTKAYNAYKTVLVRANQQPGGQSDDNSSSASNTDGISAWRLSKIDVRGGDKFAVATVYGVASLRYINVLADMMVFAFKPNNVRLSIDMQNTVQSSEPCMIIEILPPDPTSTLNLSQQKYAVSLYSLSLSKSC